SPDFLVSCLARISRAFLLVVILRSPTSSLFPYTTLFRSPHMGSFDSGITCRNNSGQYLTHLLETSNTGQVSDFVNQIPIEIGRRSEEHTSELQSRFDLVCRLLLAKKKPSCE